jgi:hypothetical protein
MKICKAIYPCDGPWNGRATAQAVSRWLPTAAMWWDKLTLGQVFSEYFGFPCQSSFHQLLHNHHQHHLWLVQ